MVGPWSILCCGYCGGGGFALVSQLMEMTSRHFSTKSFSLNDGAPLGDAFARYDHPMPFYSKATNVG